MPKYKRIGAVEVSMKILKHLSNAKRAMDGKTLAEELGLNHTTVMLHLATLQDGHFVEQDGEGFVIGQGAALLWARRKSHLEISARRLSGQMAELQP